MENEMNIEEQPQDIKTLNEEDVLGSSEDLQSVEADKSEAERGVPIGKFKNVEDLFDAYNNLQSEFTRKCQKLAEIEKEKTAQESSASAEENSLREFLSKNQEAVVYVDELKTRVLNDEKLQKEKDPYGTAWAGFLYEKLTSPNRSQEPIVKDFVLKDEKLKNLVIENYVLQLQKQNAPIVMSSNSGERVTKVATPKPDSFENAKSVALDIFSKP